MIPFFKPSLLALDEGGLYGGGPAHRYADGQRAAFQEPLVVMKYSLGDDPLPDTRIQPMQCSVIPIAANGRRVV